MVGGVPAWPGCLLSSGSCGASGASNNPGGNVNSWEAGQSGRPKSSVLVWGGWLYMNQRCGNYIFPKGSS